MSNRPYAILLMTALDHDETVLDAQILPSNPADTIEHAIVLRNVSTPAKTEFVVHTANLEGVRKPGEISYFWGHYFRTEAQARAYFDQKRTAPLGAHTSPVA